MQEIDNNGKLHYNICISCFSLLFGLRSQLLLALFLFEKENRTIAKSGGICYSIIISLLMVFEVISAAVHL
jgi:hypothetical protein